MLARTKKIARAAHLQVGVRNLKAIGCTAHGLQPLLRLFILRVGDEDASGGAPASPHAPAQLMEL